MRHRNSVEEIAHDSLLVMRSGISINYVDELIMFDMNLVALQGKVKSIVSCYNLLHCPHRRHYRLQKGCHYT